MAHEMSLNSVFGLVEWVGSSLGLIDSRVGTGRAALQLILLQLAMLMVMIKLKLLRADTLMMT
jgi:hypothetical protein